MNVLGLVQLTQAAQGAGGYAYSFGVEQLAASGRLHTPDQVASLVQNLLLTSIAPADGIASGIAFRAARQGNLEDLPRVCDVLSSSRLPVPMRLASLQMGTRLWGLSRTWEWATGIHQQFDELATHADLHHAVAFGTLVSETTSSQLRAIATCLLNTAKSIIMTAVRAIPLEEATGEKILAALQPTITQLATTCADKSPTDIPPLNTDHRDADPFRKLFP
jgi:urease accessory protein